MQINSYLVALSLAIQLLSIYSGNSSFFSPDLKKHCSELDNLAGAYTPVLLTRLGKKAGAEGGRSLTYVLGNMLSAGGTAPSTNLCSHTAHLLWNSRTALYKSIADHCQP